jgi:diguanylate cyclase (GGDEF)-like protein
MSQTILPKRVDVEIGHHTSLMSRFAVALSELEESVWRAIGRRWAVSEDPNDGLASARTLVRSIALMGVASLVGLTGFILAGPNLASPETRLFAIIGSGIFCLVELLSIILVLKGRKRSAGHVMMSATWLTVFTVILLTGGIFHSVALPLLMVIPCICYCLGNVRAGLIAAASAPFAVFLCQTFLGRIGVTLPDYTSHASAGFNNIMLTGSTYVMVALCIGGLVRSNQKLHAQLRVEHQKLEGLARIDALTGIANRRGFDQALAKALDESSHVGLILMDLNGFKPINDRYGHPAGDEVLKIVASRLKSSSGGQRVVARLGGDEFAIIVPSCNDQAGLEAVANHLRQGISAPMEVNGHTLTVGAAIGFARAPQDGTGTEALIRAADDALYYDKRGALIAGPWKSAQGPVPPQQGAAKSYANG